MDINLKEGQEYAKDSLAHLADFIPYACHYNKDTILTKNGELLQVIEIKGFAHNKASASIADVRERLRSSILEAVKSKHIAIYFHTIRNEVNMDDDPKFPNYLSQRLHESWVKANHWDYRHINNLYITIIRQGIDLNFYTYLKKPLISLITKTHDDALIESLKGLEGITSSILTKLEAYGPTKLGMFKDNEKGYCSSLLNFFSKIIHIRGADFPITIEDLSRSLAVNHVAFGFNALEIKSNSSKFFATIFSIKENNDIKIDALEKFLQMPQQMIITQTVNFIENKKGYKEIDYQNQILEVSGDNEFKLKSGFVDIPKMDQAALNPFCSTQTTVMVIATDLDKLKHDTLQVYKTLSSLGLPAVREDLNLENCFWSQLPANFSYLVRQSTSLSKKMGNFAILNNLPFGELKSKWGNFVTLLETFLRTPYFFNFHVGDNGHTIIIGDDYRTQSVMLNFLLSEALKFNTKFIYLDSYKRSELYIKSLGVKYKIFNFDKNVNQLTMNPLLLEDNLNNRSFLKYWFIFLLNKYTDPEALSSYLPIVTKAIDVLYSLPQEKRKLKHATEFFIDKETEKLNKEIITKLQEWLGTGRLAHIFDNDSDCFIEGQAENFAIDVGDIHDTSMNFNLPVLTYILHVFKEYFTGSTPSALCVAEGSRVFNSIYFEKNLEYILEDLMAKNSIVLMHASFCSEKVNWSEKIARTFNKKFATQIFIADSMPSYNNIVQLFDLTDQEKMYLQSLNLEARQFLLRQKLMSLVLKFDLSICEKELAILYGNHKYAEAANELIESKGIDPNAWLPALYEKELE